MILEIRDDRQIRALTGLVLGTQFNLARSKAHTQVFRLSLLFHSTLVQLEMMPPRAFTSVEEMTLALQDVDPIIIDDTERTGQRPQDAQQ